MQRLFLLFSYFFFFSFLFYFRFSFKVPFSANGVENRKLFERFPCFLCLHTKSLQNLYMADRSAPLERTYTTITCFHAFLELMGFILRAGIFLFLGSLRSILLCLRSERGSLVEARHQTIIGEAIFITGINSSTAVSDSWRAGLLSLKIL